MTKREVKKADLPALIKAYSESAMIQGQATESSDYKTGNKASELISVIYSELRHRGIDSQRALIPLLGDSDPGVRLWAASHAMEFSPTDGEPVLKSLITVGRFLGLCAKTTLEEWKKGRLSFP
jgi:hypothetical protein